MKEDVTVLHSRTQMHYSIRGHKWGIPNTDSSLNMQRGRKTEDNVWGFSVRVKDEFTSNLQPFRRSEVFEEL